MIKIEKGMGFYLIKSDIYCDLLTCIDCAKINYIFILKLYFYSECELQVNNTFCFSKIVF